MKDLIEAYLSVYEESDVAERTKKAVEHQRKGTHGDDHEMEKESEESTNAVKKATKHRGPKVTPSLPESYVELNQKRQNKMGDQVLRHMKRGTDDDWEKIYNIENQRDTQTPEVSKAKSAANRNRPEAEKRSKTVNETVDLYDVILEHLLDEGYANTEEDALAIMANMSEEWIDSIFEENDKKQEKGAKWNKGQKLKDPRAQKVFDHMTKKVNETVDLYDVILEHLLDEGYADTEENAITIMANMSEAWIDGILDEAQIMSVYNKDKGVIKKINPNILRLQNAAARERQGRQETERSATNARNAARLDAANKRGIDRATNRSDRTDFTPGSALRANERDELPTDYRARRRRAKG